MFDRLGATTVDTWLRLLVVENVVAENVVAENVVVKNVVVKNVVAENVVVENGQRHASSEPAPGMPCETHDERGPKARSPRPAL